jgi:small subunit ribosomal protein S9
MADDERQDQDVPQEGEAAPEQPAAEEAPAEEAAAPAEDDAPAEQPAAEEAPAEEAAAEEAAAPAEPKEKKRGKDKAEEKKEEVIPGADLQPDLVLEERREEQPLDEEDVYAEGAEGDADGESADSGEAEDAPIAITPMKLAADARYSATGKRKTAVARVILKPGSGEYLINGTALEQAFPRATLQKMARDPLAVTGNDSRMDVVARIHGGGVASQASALRHGIARALVEADPNLRGELKRRGFLTRDPRVKERKKAGLKKARKRPQFSKR